MLNVKHSSAYLFFISPFSSSMASASEMSQLQQSSVPLQFPLPNVVIGTDATLIYWAFYNQGSSFPHPVVDPGLVLCAGLKLPCKNSRLLH